MINATTNFELCSRLFMPVPSVLVFGSHVLFSLASMKSRHSINGLYRASRSLNVVWHSTHLVSHNGFSFVLVVFRFLWFFLQTSSTDLSRTRWRFGENLKNNSMVCMRHTIPYHIIYLSCFWRLRECYIQLARSTVKVHCFHLGTQQGLYNAMLKSVDWMVVGQRPNRHHVP